ncbi:BolA family transcriptional regulator [Pseudomonas sp. C27(2019)]|uniref:BolA family protein n=1 Tax=Pseudomonas sp. C27(2019) TaxID=2604941 RepID=UPI001248A42A|nr:BolA family protein [Pseudomonas sp. C27(2019)]QEY58022.1 BolA family transcriptional regulator [Pseudomonas sp. C27(2019)]
MQAVAVKQLLEEKLPNAYVEVEGEGCNFQLNIVCDDLAALGPLKRQQAVNAVLSDWIANGSIHAVTMKFYTRTAWAERS